MPLTHSFLVVDDSKLHHQMYTLIFSRGPLADSTIYHAFDGREGYSMFTAHPELTCVFLDLNMPGMNGIEFLERRRADKIHPGVPVVMVTTEAKPEDEARGRSAGAYDYLRKPFRPADIEAVVRRILAAARPARG